MKGNKPITPIKRTPKKLTADERAKFDKALALLQKSMEGVDVADALRHIRKGRQDRWFLAQPTTGATEMEK